MAITVGCDVSTEGKVLVGDTVGRSEDKSDIGFVIPMPADAVGDKVLGTLVAAIVGLIVGSDVVIILGLLLG